MKFFINPTLTDLKMVLEDFLACLEFINFLSYTSKSQRVLGLTVINETVTESVEFKNQCYFKRGMRGSSLPALYYT